MEIQEGRYKVLIDGGDAVFAPDGLIERFASCEIRQRFGGWGIAAYVAACVFVDEQAALGIYGVLEQILDAWLESGNGGRRIS